MDPNEKLKKLKEQSTYLVNRERELKSQLESIKQLKAQNTKREAEIAKLSAQLERELADL